MQAVIVLAVLVAAAVAVPVAPVVDPKTAETVRYNVNNIGVDGYSFDLETNDGKKVSEEAVLKNNQVLEVRGSFSYYGPNNELFTVTYVADENGFKAFGDHLPK
ncbi:flexible cuticle protein 12-like [Bicyclus anynana]|uniref:Flexible cuticle protein 12-like n=1 Tax=Bicyclus anynana TaxID=110368 RepID=A0A6J1NJP9_BICAN|nr:flexible cuticle protein 12-like [Bicyclus anynana]